MIAFFPHNVVLLLRMNFTPKHVHEDQNLIFCRKTTQKERWRIKNFISDEDPVPSMGETQ